MDKRGEKSAGAVIPSCAARPKEERERRAEISVPVPGPHTYTGVGGVADFYPHFLEGRGVGFFPYKTTF